MSLFRWLFPAPKTKPAADHARMAGSRAGGRHAAPDAQATRKSERMAKRELLYAVVRQAMVRAGVLSSAYKFKVLSLDAKGQQFLVMVDLARAQGGDPARLAEIEAMIAQAAKSRHEIVVSAVYWRISDYVAVGDPSAPAQGDNSQPAALDSHPAALDSGPGALGATSAQRVPSRFEPIQADEVAAFKSALAAGVSGAAALAAAAPAASAAAVRGGANARTFDGSARHGPQSYTLLTGYEDTELPESEARMPVLSGTQYGELR